MAAATFPTPLHPDDDTVGEFSSCWPPRGNEMGNLRIASLVMAVGIYGKEMSLLVCRASRVARRRGSNGMNFKGISRRPRMEVAFFFMHTRPISARVYLQPRTLSAYMRLLIESPDQIELERRNARRS